MIRWTHIVAVLYIDIYRETNGLSQYMSRLLNLAPKITGDNNDANVFVNTFIQNKKCMATITIVGDLKNRTESQTREEYNTFVEYIEEKCEVRNKTVTYKVRNKSINIVEG